jgi:hypothetical protein
VTRARGLNHTCRAVFTYITSRILITNLAFFGVLPRFADPVLYMEFRVEPSVSA